MPERGDMTGTWDDILHDSDEAAFVGREQEIFAFHNELTNIRPNRLITYISGQGGVGKSTLLARFRQISEQSGYVTAVSDELQEDLPSVLGAFAEQLSYYGFKFKRFDERYKKYRQLIESIEADPEAPHGLASMLGKTVVRVGFTLADEVPVLKQGAKFVDQATLETQASDWATYLVKRITNKDEVALVKNPTSVLTPIFAEELNGNVEDKSPVLLCFDNFEFTREYLQDWLIQLPKHRLSWNIRFLIAGRTPPGPMWERLGRITNHIRLDVFSDDEADSFLDLNAVQDPHRRRQILELSGRLPVLMSWLAATDPEDSDYSVPTEDIVERFLRWVKDTTLRRIALLAATPRVFDLDVISKIADFPHGPALDNLFMWLTSMPFVSLQSDGWKYHSVVRVLMLRYLHQRSDTQFAETNERLALHYEALQLKASEETENVYSSSQWQSATKERLYHRLLEAPEKNWVAYLEDFVKALKYRQSFAEQLMTLIRQPELRELLSESRIQEGELYRSQLAAIQNENFADGLEMFSALCKYEHKFSDLSAGISYGYLAKCNVDQRDFETAIENFNIAIQHTPNDPWLFAWRGESFRIIAEYEKAIQDFSKALEFRPDYGWALASRGQTYRQMQAYEEAIIDLQNAMQLDSFGIHLGSKELGLVYFEQGRFVEAAKCFTRAVETSALCYESWVSLAKALAKIKPCDKILREMQEIAFEDDVDIGVVHGMRGSALHLVDCHDGAIQDITLALEHDHTTHALCRRLADSLAATGEVDSAIEALNLSLQSWPDCISCLFRRARLYNEVGDQDSADNDYKTIMNLVEDERDYNHHGLMMSHHNRFSEAKILYEKALENDPSDPYALYNLAVLLRYQTTDSLGSEQVLGKAVSTLTKLLSSADSSGVGFYGLAGLAAVSGQTDQAFAYLQEALKIHPEAKRWAEDDIAWRNLRSSSKFHELLDTESSDLPA